MEAFFQAFPSNFVCLAFFEQLVPQLGIAVKVIGG
jgi:hypothetical protein